MIILGIDPGFAIVGYGVIEYKAGRFRTLGYGAVTTPAHIEMPKRLQMIYDELTAIMAKYRPDDVAIEELFFHSNHTTAIAVAEARGIILLTAQQAGVRIFEYTPLQVKQAVVGYGRAEKKQVIAMTNQLLSLEKGPKLDDTADALAIAVCHAHTGASRLREFYNVK
ncbi:MAG: crossover junction endodeoxyribonuclease RuvC [Clostridiales bacterium]|nr:crossover junction endodeoxyribonuclease RuvC [Clostridiales bacterium]